MVVLRFEYPIVLRVECVDVVRIEKELGVRKGLYHSFSIDLDNEKWFWEGKRFMIGEGVIYPSGYKYSGRIIGVYDTRSAKHLDTMLKDAIDNFNQD